MIPQSKLVDPSAIPEDRFGHLPGEGRVEPPLEVEVERKTIKYGGYYSLGKKEYWFKPDLYDIVEKKDEETPNTHKGSKEFAKWLKAFIEEHDIKPEKSYSSNTRSMAGYWAMPYTYNVDERRGVTEHTIKQASVLRAMRTVVSVVDPEHKLTIRYNQAAMTSSYDMKGGKDVILPVDPVKEIDDLEECINTMSGFTTHEAFHSIETRKMVTPELIYWLLKSRWNGLLMNILEDPRIEEIGLAETPGYREYLNYVMEYLWSEDKLPTKWPDDPSERFAAAISIIRYADRIDEIFTDESFNEPRKWLREWSDSYTREQGSNPTAERLYEFVQRGRDFFGIEEKPEEEGGGDSPEPALGLGKLTICGYAEDGSALGDGAADAIAVAIEEESDRAERGSSKFKAILGAMGGWEQGYGAQCDSVVIRRPRARGRYRSSRSDLIAKAKSALALKNTLMQHDTRLMKSGVLDEDELYRLASGDLRIFKDATVESNPSAAVYMLVDMSGSMHPSSGEGGAAYYATRLAQVFVEALVKRPNVKIKVLGHSGQNHDNSGGASFYRIWEPGDSLNRLSILNDSGLYSQNFDGFAIAWAGEMLRQEPYDQKLLIVLADGIPAAGGYGGNPALSHVRRVTDTLDRQGVKVVQVAVSPYLDEKDQRAMFKHYIAVNSYDSLSETFSIVLRKLTKLLERVLR